MNYLKIKEKNLFPLSGVSNSKTIYNNENGYFMIYDSDRYGFNNPDYEWDSEKIEYILIGDSFVHGAAVNRPDDIASQLRILSGKASLNLGYSANGPLIEYATLKEFMPQKVNKVLWFFFDNDVRGFDYEVSDDILKNYLINENFLQNLKNKQPLVDQLAKDMIKNQSELKKKRFFLIRFLKLYELRKVFLQREKSINKDFSNMEKIFNLAKKFSEKNGAEFYIVYLPTDRYCDEEYDNYYYEKIKKVSLQNNYNLINIHEELFNQVNNPLDFFPFGYYGHYNEKGYHETAKIIYEKTK